jgi:hypothetical protein
LVSSSSRWPTRLASAIDKSEVITASTINPAAMPTIFCLMDFRNMRRARPSPHLPSRGERQSFVAAEQE